MPHDFDPKRFLLFLPILLISIAIHEFAHCWVTDRLGDDTPRLNGRVTLNPLKHLDLWGTLAIVFSSIYGFGFGWGKSSPMNPYNFRHPSRDRMLAAAAGPASNLLQMLAWASLGVLVNHFLFPEFSFVKYSYGLVQMPVAISLIWRGVIVNASLAVFNLLPVYPLDGHHILGYLLPEFRPIIDNPIWGVVFLIIVFNTNLLSKIITPVLLQMIHICGLLIGWPLLS
jgi:Zn-dependent protease